MPAYRVIAPGFFEGARYDPRGNRNRLVSEKKLDPVPSWLEPIKGEEESKPEPKKAAGKKAEPKKAAVEEQGAGIVEKSGKRSDEHEVI